MARYSSLLGKRVEVLYRAGDVHLPATGTVTADSGKSIFLEEQFVQDGKVKTFRWEIPYPYILSLKECTAGEASSEPTTPKPAAGENAQAESKVVPFRRREVI